MKRKRKSKIASEIKLPNGMPLDPFSSLNDYLMCVCGKKYSYKISLIKHTKFCSGINNHEICPWCKLEFKNRGNLVTHAFHMHGDKSFKNYPDGNLKSVYKCEGCDASFYERWRLKFHIRRHHFNLLANVPHAETKEVNQVWFEKVMNSNIVVQIKKIGFNTLVMKPIPPDAGVETHDNYKKVDLRGLYPTSHKTIDETCKVCLKSFRKFDLPKHMNETHFNLMKHKCNNCNQTFKRSYLYLKHVCHKEKFMGTKRKRKVDGVTRQSKSSEIRITEVASLEAVQID